MQGNDIKNMRITNDEKKALANPERIAEQPFLTLGHNASNFYFFSPELHTVLILKSRQFKWAFLFTIAPPEYWKKHFKTNDKRWAHGVDWDRVKHQLTKDAEDAGLFKGLRYMQKDRSIRTKKTV